MTVAMIRLSGQVSGLNYSCNCIAFGMDTEADYLFSTKVCLNTKSRRVRYLGVV